MDSNPNKQKREGKSTKTNKKHKQVEIDTTPSNTGVKKYKADHYNLYWIFLYTN